MLRSDFYCKLEGVLEVPRGSISGDADLQSIGNWDSMAALTFMSMVDEEFGIQITGDQLQGCRSTNDLVRLLGNNIQDQA